MSWQNRNCHDTWQNNTQHNNKNQQNNTTLTTECCYAGRRYAGCSNSFVMLIIIAPSKSCSSINTRANVIKLFKTVIYKFT